MKITIRALAEGEGKVDITKEMQEFAEETSCEFFGDYSGITPPLTLAQAKETILAIEGAESHSLGVPIQVTLTPLSSLTSAAMKIVADLSAGAVNEAARLLQDIEDIQVILKTLENSQTAAEYYKYRTTIGLVANRYRNKGSELKSKLCKILPQIKGNGAEEQVLMDAIRTYDESSFSKAKTLQWLKTLEDEVIYVDNLIKLAKKEGIPMATEKSKFRGKRLEAKQGLFYLEAKFLSCLKITGEEENGEVSLRTGSVLDDDDFGTNFDRQFNNFMTAISEGGLRNKDADVNILFYLEFLAEENHCDIKFFEMGSDTLREIDTNSEAGSVKYEPLENTVTGEIRPRDWWMGDTCQVAAEGGFIKLQLRYTEQKAEAQGHKAEEKAEAQGEKGEEKGEVDQGDEPSTWDHNKPFKHEAEKTSFQLDLGEQHGLREGSLYNAQLRYEIR